VSRPARRARRIGLVPLVGWLFADLLLVLTLVSLGGQGDPLAADRRGPSPSATGSPLPTGSGPSSRPTPNGPTPNGPAPSRPTPSGPRAVEKASVKFTVHGTDPADLVDQIRRATESYRRRQAALVLTFGGGSTGEEYASKVNGLLAGARPGLFPPGTATRDYLNLSGQSRTAKLEVFFYTYPH
jgi:hypothetical protein